MLTAERLDIPPEHQLIFEDSHNGIIAAKEARSIPVGMPTIDQPAVIERLKDAGAAEIFTNWQEINIERLLRRETERSCHTEKLL